MGPADLTWTFGSAVLFFSMAVGGWHDSCLGFRWVSLLAPLHFVRCVSYEYVTSKQAPTRRREKNMSQEPSLPNYLRYLPEHKVVVCCLCEHAIGPELDGIERHLCSKHKSVEFKVRRRLAESTKGWDLAQPNEVTTPERGSPPVEGLRVLHGWACDECSFACPSEASMIEHCRKEHRLKKADGRRWQPKKVQDFLSISISSDAAITVEKGANVLPELQ